MKFVSKPTEIEAWRYSADLWFKEHTDGNDWPDWVQDMVDSGAIYLVITADTQIAIKGKQGFVYASVGDWLIRELDGSGAYPCADEVFQKKYDHLSTANADRLMVGALLDTRPKHNCLALHVERGSYAWACTMLDLGERLVRRGWNGKDMWLCRIPANGYGVQHDGIDGNLDLLPWIGMKTADGKFVPWLCSQTDREVKDWEIVT